MTPEQLQLWTPYTVANGRIILTGDRMPDKGTVLVGAWKAMPCNTCDGSGRTATGKCPECFMSGRPCVAMPMDLFAPCEGPVMEPSGRFVLLRNGLFTPQTIFDSAIYRGDFMIHADILRDVFNQLDARPKVRLLAVCGKPDRLQTRRMCPAGERDVRRDNLTILAGPIRTRAGLERLAPAVRGLRDLCSVGLWFDGPMEPISGVERLVGPQNEGQWASMIEYGLRPSDYGIKSILLTSRNDYTEGIEQQVEGTGVEVWKL